MKLFKRTPRADEPPAVAKRHCATCNGVRTVQKRDYDQPPNAVGTYPLVDVLRAARQAARAPVGHTRTT